MKTKLTSFREAADPNIIVTHLQVKYFLGELLVIHREHSSLTSDVAMSENGDEMLIQEFFLFAAHRSILESGRHGDSVV